jgi:hypothetical protein
MQPTTAATVSERAVIGRINRRLEKDQQRLAAARMWPGGYEDGDTGRFYVFNTYSNTITRSHVKLESFARELGALGSSEVVSSN